jgi:hypothetical protein
VAKEKHNKEKQKKTFRDGIVRRQMILVKNVKFNNTTSGGIQEIIIAMREQCCIKIRRNLLRILRGNIYGLEGDIWGEFFE